MKGLGTQMKRGEGKLHSTSVGEKKQKKKESIGQTCLTESEIVSSANQWPKDGMERVRVVNG